MLAPLARKTFRTSDGCVIAYELRPASAPNAPRVALIHPLALDGTIWHRVATRLGRDVSLLTYDCRGHGRSGRGDSEFSIELFARDLTQLFDHIEWPMATVAGCSMGGCVALGFAAYHPSRLNGLVLIDTTAWYGDDAPEKWRERAAMAKHGGLGSMSEFQVQRWFSDGFRSAHPGLVADVCRIFQANDVGAYESTCVMLGDLDLRPMQQFVRVPTAIVVGGDDYATPVPMSMQMRDAVRNSELTVLPGIRHLTPIEAPDSIAAHIRGLLLRTGN